MQKASLAAVARQQVDRDAGAGGRHTAEGARLAEHETPGEATVQVLHGRVRMISGAQSWEARTETCSSCPTPAPASRRWRIPRSC